MGVLSKSFSCEERASQLEKRLEKAQARLTKAEKENDDNVEAFRMGAEKLEQKLAAAKEAFKEH